MAPVKKPKRTRQKTYFLEWRETAGLTQADAAERLGWSQSKISRVETKGPYNQDDVEMAAEVYGCLTAELLMVNPKEPESFYGLLARAAKAKPAVQEQIASYLKFTLRDS